ncbi:prepilin peptidase [Paenibacillus donghaensis]|uniref:A24 family peptidase n=1 Tax=Paenibacillus donghaensis TaxID=414771 RepID=UPI0018839C57|nr:A24 family peptidase [Paenibacillus donghaensis]MBE9917938.1 prepilin peptidase [Paenibacillus donghaensis]
MDVSIWGCMLMVIIAFITDIRTMKIPNWLTLTAMPMGVTVHTVMDGLQGLLFSLKGLAAGFVLVLLMHVIGAVGAGDVKLFGGIGAWAGTLFTVQCLVYSVLCAGAIGILILLWRRETLQRMRKAADHLAGFFMLRSFQALTAAKEKQMRFPFMLAVVPGYVITCIYAAG